MTIDLKLEAIIKEYRKQFMARFRVPAHRVDQVIANQLATQETFARIQLAMSLSVIKEDKQSTLKL